MADTAVDLALALAKRFEGCRLKAYWDAAGKVWTVGYGCTGAGINGTTAWSQDQADDEVCQRLTAAYQQAVRLSPTLSAADVRRQAAITDFIFNLGCGAYRYSTLRACVDAGDWVGAAIRIRAWDHAGGVVLAGLVRRRQAEAALLELVDD
jgi:lysozyme